MAFLFFISVLAICVGISFSFKSSRQSFFSLKNSEQVNKYHISSSSSSSQKSSNKLYAESSNFFSFLKFPGGSSSTSQKVSIKEKANTIKSAIKELSQGTNNGITASSEVKNKISEYVKELEKINPTKALTSDASLDGMWKLVYTTNEGSSAGKLGPFVGAVEQDIQLGNSIYYNSVTLGPKLVKGTLSATWDVKNSKLWTVKFQDITFELFGIKVLQKSLGVTIGTWRMSYLDNDMRILYAIGGKNTIIENVYILSK